LTSKVSAVFLKFGLGPADGQMLLKMKRLQWAVPSRLAPDWTGSSRRVQEAGFAVCNDEGLIRLTGKGERFVREVAAIKEQG
jgi:hypothetical protein